MSTPSGSPTTACTPHPTTEDSQVTNSPETSTQPSTPTTALRVSGQEEAPWSLPLHGTPITPITCTCQALTLAAGSLPERFGVSTSARRVGHRTHRVLPRLAPQCCIRG